MPTRTRKVSKLAKAATRRTRKPTTRTHRRRKTIRKQIRQSGGLSTCEEVFTRNGVGKYKFFGKELKYDELIGDYMVKNPTNSGKVMVALQKKPKTLNGEPVGCDYYLYVPEGMTPVTLEKGNLIIREEYILLNPEIKERKLASSRHNLKNPSATPSATPSAASNSSGGHSKLPTSMRSVKAQFKESNPNTGTQTILDIITQKNDLAEISIDEDDSGREIIVKTIYDSIDGVKEKTIGFLETQQLSKIEESQIKEFASHIKQPFFTVFKANDAKNYLCSYTNNQIECKNLQSEKPYDSIIPKDLEYISLTTIEHLYDEPIHTLGSTDA